MYTLSLYFSALSKDTYVHAKTFRDTKDEWPKRCETKERRRRSENESEDFRWWEEGERGRREQRKGSVARRGRGRLLWQSEAIRSRERERERISQTGATLPSFTENPPQLSPSQHARTTRCSKMAAQLARRSPGASLDHALHSPNSTAFHGADLASTASTKGASRTNTTLLLQEELEVPARCDRFFPEITQSRHLSCLILVFLNHYFPFLVTRVYVCVLVCDVYLIPYTSRKCLPFFLVFKQKENRDFQDSMMYGFEK